jgi:hypothetical protein
MHVFPGDTVSFTVNVSDPDSTIPFLGAIELPDNSAFIDSGNGTGYFSFLPDSSQFGDQNATFIAYDFEDSLVTTQLTVTIIVYENQLYLYLPADANMAVGQYPPALIGGDVTWLVNYFRGLAEPCIISGFYLAGDTNGDCMVIGGDVTWLVNYFRGLSDVSYCPDFPPAWLSPDDCPVDSPGGWPNCE